MAGLGLVRALRPRTTAIAALAGLFSATAHSGRAGDLFAGVYDHALFASASQEHGADIMLGYRTAPVQGWTWLAKPSVHLILSGNTEVSTDFVALGLNWPIGLGFGGRLYVRPGFGVAYTNGEADVGNSADLTVSPAEHQERLRLARTRIDFGSHAQFEPELAFGYKLTPRVAVEASYVHLSNGQIFHQGKNQGLDDAGLRVAYSF